MLKIIVLISLISSSLSIHCNLNPKTAVKWYLHFHNFLEDSKQVLIGFSKNEWIEISSIQNLPEHFIDTFADMVEWEAISYHQTLNERLMRKYTHKIDWYWIFELKKHIPTDLKIKLNNYFSHHHYEYLKGQFMVLNDTLTV